MSEDNTTDGLPSSDLFDLTAPNNEYLTDVQSTISTGVVFIPFETFSPIKLPPLYESIDLLRAFRQIGDLDKVTIEKSEDYSEYVNSEDLISSFSEILEEYLVYYIKMSINKPITCELLMFVFPGEDYKEPMIKIVYPDSDDFNNLEIRDDLEEKFKVFLVNNSKDLEEYKAFRQIQKKFRFVIKRE